VRNIEFGLVMILQLQLKIVLMEFEIELKSDQDPKIIKDKIWQAIFECVDIRDIDPTYLKIKILEEPIGEHKCNEADLVRNSYGIRWCKVCNKRTDP